MAHSATVTCDATPTGPQRTGPIECLEEHTRSVGGRQLATIGGMAKRSNRLGNPRKRRVGLGRSASVWEDWIRLSG